MHLTLAHQLWKQKVLPGDCVIDATCGNGHDTLFLSELVGEGTVIGFDIQEKALCNTRERLKKDITLYCQSHATLKDIPLPKRPRGIVYNLGYLPGGNKELTTRMETTLQSIGQALEIVSEGGFLSVMCYPGHPEGERETCALESFFQTLDRKVWKVDNYVWKEKAPRLFFIQKIDP